MSASQLIKKIPFETIGRGVGLVITVYTYSKITIKVYRYYQRLIIRYKKRKFQKAVKVLTCLTYWKFRNSKVYAIYRLAVFHDSIEIAKYTVISG